MKAPAGQTVKPPPFRIAQIGCISVTAVLWRTEQRPESRIFAKNLAVRGSAPFTVCHSAGFNVWFTKLAGFRLASFLFSDR
jgi:hypothetical protein